MRNSRLPDGHCWPFRRPRQELEVVPNDLGLLRLGADPHRGFVNSRCIHSREGLRVAEVVDLTWDEIHFDDGTILIRRVKNGLESRHFLEGDEIRQLKQHRRESPESRFVFCSERGGPLSNRSAHHIVKKGGEAAGLSFSVHPHMLRHANAFRLAQQGADTRAIQGYLGHRDIKSTVIYTALAPDRFKGFGTVHGVKQRGMTTASSAAALRENRHRPVRKTRSPTCSSMPAMILSREVPSNDSNLPRTSIGHLVPDRATLL